MKTLIRNIDQNNSNTAFAMPTSQGGDAKRFVKVFERHAHTPTNPKTRRKL